MIVVVVVVRLVVVKVDYFEAVVVMGIDVAAAAVVVELLCGFEPFGLVQCDGRLEFDDAATVELFAAFVFVVVVCFH